MEFLVLWLVIVLVIVGISVEKARRQGGYSSCYSARLRNTTDDFLYSDDHSDDDYEAYSFTA